MPPPSRGGGKSPLSDECAATRESWTMARAFRNPQAGGVKSMADQILTNQKSILGNQKTILANQKTIVKNQADIQKNQKALSTIIANQKEILRNQKAILDAFRK
jgi:hypothetical protein